MAKAKSPRATKPTAKSRTAKKILQMPESGNGNTPQYSPADLEAEIRFRAYELYEQRGARPARKSRTGSPPSAKCCARHDSHKHTA